MIRPRWVLPLPDLAAPAFLFRAGTNRLKLIFSIHNHEYFRHDLFGARPHQVIRDAPPNIRDGRIILDMGVRHRDHYYGGLLTRSSDTKPRRQPRPAETKNGSWGRILSTRVRGAMATSRNRNATGTNRHSQSKSRDQFTRSLATIPSPQWCESRRR